MSTPFATVKELSQATSETRGTSLVTVLVPGEASISQVTSQLTSELGTASNIKDKSVRSSVQAALRSGLQKMKTYPGHKAGPNGLVLLAGEIKCRV
jgi:peptide subunit release factor 1 (eRF1)